MLTGLSKKEQARYRSIVSRISRLKRHGWNEETHVDYEPLVRELASLAEKMAGQSWYCDQCQAEVYQLRCKYCGKSESEKT